MKLVRYGNPGKEKPGLIDADGKLRDLRKLIIAASAIERRCEVSVLRNDLLDRPRIERPTELLGECFGPPL